MANTGNTQQQINYGASANDGQGDPLRTAFIKTDDNFDNVWLAGPVGSNITIGNNTIQSNNTNGNIVLKPNGTGIVQANASIIPNADNTRDLGSSALAWRRAYINELLPDSLTVSGDAIIGGNLTVQGDTIQIGNITTDTLTVQLANTAANATAANGAGITVGASDNIATILYNSTANRWNVSVGVSAVGNISAPYFIGNGSLLTGITGYGNANVANYLPTYGGNISAGNINVSNVVNITQNLNVKTGTFTGDATGDNSIYAGFATFTVLGTDVIAQFAGNTNSYTQFNFQNYNTGNQSSGDYVITADNGNDTTHFLNIGLTGGNWNGTQNNSLGNLLDPNDGYLYVQDGNLAVGTRDGSNSYVWTFDTTGNMTLSGNTFAVNYANGVAVSLSSYGNANVANYLPTYSGNINAGNINVTDSVNITQDLYVKTGTFTGDSKGENSIYAGVPLFTVLGSDVVAQFSGNVDAYTQFNFQNGNSGSMASGDYVITANNGDDETFFFNMGLGSNNHSDPDFFGDTSTPNDAYIYVVGADATGPGDTGPGNLLIGSTNGVIKMFVGNTAQANVVQTITTSGVTVKGNIIPSANGVYSLGNSTNYWANLWVGNITTSNISVSGNITGGNISTGVITLTNGATIRDTSGDAVAFGQNAGLTSQGNFAVGIGRNAGQTTQGGAAVAIGVSAGDTSQGNSAVAVGQSAGFTNQSANTVAVGVGAGQTSQGVDAVAVGASAGSLTQGIAAVAIGTLAGRTFQANNSIIINATGANLDQTTANTFTVAPIRNDVANVAEILFYDTTSKEITYGNTISVAGNITGNYILGNGSQLTSINAVTVDITDTNGLTTVYYPTFVENRTTAQIARADVDLTYRTDDNLLTVGNVSVTGNITGNTAGFAIGYRDIPQVSFTGNATIATTDAGKHFYSTQSTDYILTIANNASQGFQTGAAITVINQGTGNITLAQGSGVTLYLTGNATSGNRTVTTFGMATLIKVATDTWFVSGAGVI